MYKTNIFLKKSNGLQIKFYKHKLIIIYLLTSFKNKDIEYKIWIICFAIYKNNNNNALD